MSREETKLWPPALKQNAKLLWPNWEKQDVFYWNSQIPIAAIIVSERNPTTKITNDREIKQPQLGNIYGEGVVVGNVKYGKQSISKTGTTLWAPQAIYLCSNPIVIVPNQNCRGRLLSGGKLGARMCLKHSCGKATPTSVSSSLEASRILAVK